MRILGEVTAERLALLQEADAIFLDELRESGWYEKVSQAFAVLLPVKSVGVMGDCRTYENVVALRAVETHDFMTADWCHLPHELLGRVATRIINEVKGVNRVVYDVTSKPPATIEWGVNGRPPASPRGRNLLRGCLERSGRPTAGRCRFDPASPGGATAYSLGRKPQEADFTQHFQPRQGRQQTAGQGSAIAPAGAGELWWTPFLGLAPRLYADAPPGLNHTFQTSPQPKIFDSRSSLCCWGGGPPCCRHSPPQ